jgi:non-lysosomal glucosylceramidase
MMVGTVHFIGPGRSRSAPAINPRRRVNATWPIVSPGTWTVVRGGLSARAISMSSNSRRYDELLWNGEFYIQLLDESAPPEDQFGTGCLADQLFGQWWAHLLDLGYLLPAEHVRTTLRSIVRYNVRRGFQGFEHGFRVFADRDDWGLLVCTWPHGGRPAVPVRYCDEVWTGMEYQVGAHCIIEGMVDEGLGLIAALRQRYAGTRRNPYNEIECGDHYARAMAGWSVLEAVSGLSYDATRDAVRFAPATGDGPFRAPYVLVTGWGTFEQSSDGVGTRSEVRCDFGRVMVRTLALGGIEPGFVVVEFTGAEIPSDVEWIDGGVILLFSTPVNLGAGTSLVITVSR